jgi:CMP-N-acetylneuraminic acid synthetase
MLENILGLVLARGGSKGIPKKNIRPLGGKPLILWTVEAALAAARLSRVVVSSDSEEILAIARTAGAETPFVRPAALAADDTPALPVVKHAVEHLRTEGWHADAVVLLQATSPFRTAAHIDEAITLLTERGTDSAVSVCELKHTHAPHSAMVLNRDRIEPFLAYDEHKNLRQLKPTAFFRTGGIYAVTTSCLFSKDSLYGDSITPVFMDQLSAIDIDDEFDFACAELAQKMLNTG